MKKYNRSVFTEKTKKEILEGVKEFTEPDDRCNSSNIYYGNNNILEIVDKVSDNVVNICEYKDEYMNCSLVEKTIELNYEKLPKDKDVTLLVWWTWTWKTYKAITENDNFIMAVPTRQLAYEVYLDYENVWNVDTWEIHKNWNAWERVVVYESLNRDDIDKVDTLIIDEAHFLNDAQRWTQLLDNLLYAIYKNKKIVLLTATDTISEDLKNVLDIKTEELSPFKKINRKELETEEEFLEKINEGKTTIIFTKYAPTEETVDYYSEMLWVDRSKMDYLSADVPSSDRIKKQMKFKNWETQIMISSNVLAQWVNFPAELVMIEYNERDDWEIVNQKIWRAGRPQFTDKAYYYLYDMPAKCINNRKPDIRTTEFVSKYRGIDFSKYEIQKFEMLKIEDWMDIDDIPYSKFKYSKKYLNAVIKEWVATDLEKKVLNLIYEEERVLSLILDNYKLRWVSEKINLWSIFN